MSYERIDNSPQFDGRTRDSHEARYHVASGFITDEDNVLDAGCGVGYGRDILGGKAYMGIDRNPPEYEQPDATGAFLKVDFEDPNERYDWPFVFDVFVGLEIIEHLNDEGVASFRNLARKAGKWIIISTPIVRNSNPYHKQQFDERDIMEMFAGDGWRHYETFYQSEERYGIFIFKRI